MKNQLFKSIFSKSLLSTLRLLFRHTWIVFCAKIRNKLTQSPKRDVNSTNYFYHFFLKVLLRTREMHFEEPWQKFFAIRRLLSLRYRKRSNNYSLVFSPEKTLKRSAATAPRLQFQESWQKKPLTPKVQYFRWTTKNLEQNFFNPKKRPKIVPLNFLNVVLTILWVFFV